jgi:hypothetical protein
MTIQEAFMTTFAQINDKARLEKVSENLRKRGFDALVVKDGKAALAKLKDMVPTGSEVFAMASVTLESTGIAKELNESGRFESVRAKLGSMNQATQGREMRKLGAAPDVALGSVHALTDDGIAVIASLTGSQLPAYASGAGKVIFVVGSQKIVKDMDEAMNRLQSYVVPLESGRARKAYGLPDTFNSQASKILLLQGEIQQGRVTFMLLEEAQGF